MSSTLTQVTLAAVTQNDYDAISATIGLIAILLLALLIVGKEVVRARGADPHVVGAFDVPIVPLLAAAGIVLSLRLLELIEPG
jgi:hypothetical protein